MISSVGSTMVGTEEIARADLDIKIDVWRKF